MTSWHFQEWKIGVLPVGSLMADYSAGRAQWFPCVTPSISSIISINTVTTYTLTVV